uniref:BTB domain-containing protein n=1 Tax=Strongyloides papillosus TaxID=174720 RepID=A0A0N5BNW3_STREA
MSSSGNLSLFCGCVIKFEGTEIQARKKILSAESSVFNEIFNRTSGEQQTIAIELEDFSVEVVKQMFRHVYADDISNIQSIADEMFEIADKERNNLAPALHGLKQILESYMCLGLTADNVCERLVLSGSTVLNV